MSVIVKASAAAAGALRLDARQRGILAYMGLPMQGWPVAEAVADVQAQLPAAAQALVVDTMNPAVRSLRLADLKKADFPAALPIEKISIKTPNSGVNPAWAASEKIVNADAEPGSVTSATVAPLPLQLWSLEGVEQTAAPELAQKLLLLLECATEPTGFPLSADALLLLRHILAALQCAPDSVVLCALPQHEASPVSWQAQIAAWQPALALVLGRNASRAVLGAQLQLQAGSLSAWRGQMFDVAGVAVRVSYPLDYLLRKPQAKAGAWQDWLTAKWQWDELLAAQNEKRLNS